MANTSTTNRAEIRTTLKQFGASQRDVAEALGISESAVSLWLKGEVSSPKLDAGIVGYAAGLAKSAA